MDRLSDYDYHLPEELIAQEPLDDRASAKLLHLDKATGQVHHRQFRDILGILQPGDLLVMNDTRVTARRLFGKKPSGSDVEALLLHQVGLNDYIAMVKPGRRLKVGAEIDFGTGLRAEVLEERTEGLRLLRFDSATDLRERISMEGEVPLPPYIHTRLTDPERYQTVYASEPGSAAAPTAGLHFTGDLLSQLEHLGVQRATVTLDVSIDTFRPVQVENLDEHVMHGETCTIGMETAEKIRNCRGRIIAVGTTTVRTLETFAVGPGEVRTGSGTSKLFIRPGYEFRVVTGMFTNFHMPRTTMLLMLSALVGKHHLFHAYESAAQNRYRFLSFGDSMLIL